MILQHFCDWVAERVILFSAKREGYWKDKYKELFKRKNKLPWNIYEPNAVMGEHFKKFHFIHFIFKYKLVEPLLLLGNKVFGKYIKQEVPKMHYNLNLQIFDRAYEQALHDWTWKYKRWRESPHGNLWSTKLCSEQNKTVDMLRTVKNILLTIPMNDTAYMAFFDLLMYKIGQGMNEEYKSQKVKHLFYTCADTFDVEYYIMTQVLYDERTKEIKKAINKIP